MLYYFDIGHTQGKRHRKYFKERIYKYCNDDCNAYSDNCTMKHQKEWHTCDRCGKEIKVGLLCMNSITRNGVLNTTYDLCNECMEDFEEFMRNDS